MIDGAAGVHRPIRHGLFRENFYRARERCARNRRDENTWDVGFDPRVVRWVRARGFLGAELVYRQKKKEQCQAKQEFRGVGHRIPPLAVRYRESLAVVECKPSVTQLLW